MKIKSSLDWTVIDKTEEKNKNCRKNTVITKTNVCVHTINDLN